MAPEGYCSGACLHPNLADLPQGFPSLVVSRRLLLPTLWRRFSGDRSSGTIPDFLAPPVRLYRARHSHQRVSNLRSCRTGFETLQGDSGPWWIPVRRFLRHHDGEPWHAVTLSGSGMPLRPFCAPARLFLLGPSPLFAGVLVAITHQSPQETQEWHLSCISTTLGCPRWCPPEDLISRSDLQRQGSALYNVMLPGTCQPACLVGLFFVGHAVLPFPH